MPTPGQALVDPRTGHFTNTYRRWANALTEAVNAAQGGTIIVPPDPVSFVVSGAGSVTADGSVAGGEFVVTLEGDKDNPPPNSFYGATTAGDKGFVPVYDALVEGQGIAIRDSGYIVIDTVETPDDLPLTGNSGEAVRVTGAEPGMYAWDGAAFTIDTAADGTVTVTCDATAAEITYDNTTSGLAATNVQAAVDELQAEKLGDAPSDGSEYVRKDGAWEVATAGAGGAMTLVGSATVAGSAATTLTISGLDLNAHGRYVVYMVMKNATASNAVLSLYYNGDTNGANYWRQAFNANNSALSASRGNDGAIVTLVSSVNLSGKIDIAPDIDGNPRANAGFGRDAISAIRIDMTAHAWTGTANVTSITISSSVASSLAIGSYVKVFKVG